MTKTCFELAGTEMGGMLALMFPSLITGVQKPMCDWEGIEVCRCTGKWGRAFELCARGQRRRDDEVGVVVVLLEEALRCCRGSSLV